MQIINFHRPSFTVNIENIWKNFKILEKNGLSATTRGLMRGPIQIARMNMTIGSDPWTQMLCLLKNKVGIII